MPLRLISRALPQAFTQMTDYMTSAASNTANTEMLTSVPNTTLNLLSLSLQTINGKDVFDDACLPYVYGASKILDMLGYGSFLASSNTAKAAITKAYLGQDSVPDTSNPLVYHVSQTVNLLPLLAYQKIYYDFFSNSQWEKHLAYTYQNRLLQEQFKAELENWRGFDAMYDARLKAFSLYNVMPQEVEKNVAQTMSFYASAFRDIAAGKYTLKQTENYGSVYKNPRE